MQMAFNGICRTTEVSNSGGLLYCNVGREELILKIISLAIEETGTTGSSGACTLEVIVGKVKFMCQTYTEAKRSGMIIIPILINLTGLRNGKLTKGTLAYILVVQTIHYVGII